MFHEAKENVFLPHIHSKWTYYPLPSLEEMGGRKRDLQIGKHRLTLLVIEWKGRFCSDSGCIPNISVISVLIIDKTHLDQKTLGL